ncbi:hypothetical protein WN944_025381 [Citrus x changshan-huyou]|uniref:Uncharacterized protein n=1 Tax=Citrus x changshan-huyou TaxID=2935761 RepID=A0AAP0QBF5_9ROSI
MFVAATASACRAIIGLDSKSQHPSLDGWCCRILVICEGRKTPHEIGRALGRKLTESLFTSRSTFRLLPSNGFEASHAHALHARWISRPLAARIGQRSCDFKGSEPSNLRHEFSDTTVEQNTKNNNSVARNFASIWHSDAEPIILEMGNSKVSCKIIWFGY